MKKIRISLFILGTLGGFLTESSAQTSKHKSAVLTRGFYISSIFDDRVSPDSARALLFSSNKGPITRQITLESASVKGIAKILTDSSSKNTTLMPLSVRIKECNIKESLSGTDRVNGEVNLVLAFDLEKESGTAHLTQYKSTARYIRSLTNLGIVEPTIQRLIGNSLTFINDWLNKQANSNPILAKGVDLTFSDYIEQHEDTVYYHPERPLIWGDFREKRSYSKFSASVFPSFGYDQRMKVENGKIKVELAVKVYVVKSASWVGPGAPGNYNLRHEQKHFDLVKIIAERFKKKLLTEKLSPENYQGIINFEYLEFYREMNKIQQQYDEQTSHGTNVTMQEFWNRKIEEELKQLESKS